MNTGVLSIFFDPRPMDRIIIDPHSLISHYNSALSPCFLDDIWISSHYQSVKDIIEAYKYKSIRWHAPLFAQMISSAIQKMSLHTDTVIVPVPMHWSRYFIRWYNHISLLVKHLAKQSSIPSLPLLKTLWSRRQSQLSRIWRLKNKSSIYYWNSHISTIPESVLLIDDVITTGTTLNECAKILKKQGVKYVSACVLASNQTP